MFLVDIADVKTFLGITWTQSDALIEDILIPGAESRINSILWVDTLQVTSDRVEYAKIIWCNVLYFKNFPITQIKEIWGSVVTLEEWEDYTIHKNKVTIYSTQYLQNIKTDGSIKIKYDHGYIVTGLNKNVPEDIKIAMYLLIWGLFNIRNKQGVVKCKVGPEEIEFRDTSESEDFLNILKKYKKKITLSI